MEKDKQKGARPRRLPQQVRSQQRLNKILAAAAAVFAEMGYEGATTAAIAARAGTSIGSIYQFFPDKAAIFQSLAKSYLQETRGLLAEVFSPPLHYLPFEEVVDCAVDAFSEYYLARPEYQAMFNQPRFAPEVLQTREVHTREMVLQVEAFLALRAPGLESSQREMIAMVVVEVACILEILSLRRDAEFRTNVLAETKWLIKGYLHQRLTEGVLNPTYRWNSRVARGGSR
ncbi:TetR/AcrR family transcriptional regulator [Anthocerotibacter panamensis]|uniref:TetR/AcrR family transcriptional regulator n=1 Tax=Anthocerotibacter panamensis TaxID=2857077 RepID=UPI001C407F11|nr:TetR family transcriptional regulator [Anthocerotibacter panamensis]